MKKVILSIQNPCDVKDEDMIIMNGGHFCPQCNQKVIDSTRMSDTELLAHIKKNGFGCRTMRKDQLDRTIVIPSKRRWWTLAAAVLTIFTFPTAAHAQDVKKTADTVTIKVDSNMCQNVENTLWKGRAVGEYFIDRKIERGTGSFSIVELSPKKRNMWKWLRKIFQ